MPRLTSKDCLKCGLCCCPLDDTDRYANVTSKDEERLGKKLARRLVRDADPMEMAFGILGAPVATPAIKVKRVKQKEGPLKGSTIPRCAALEGNLLCSVRCTIYDFRPDVCRKAVKPGDPTCRKLRRLYQGQKPSSTKS